MKEILKLAPRSFWDGDILGDGNMFPARLVVKAKIKGRGPQVMAIKYRGFLNFKKGSLAYS